MHHGQFIFDIKFNQLMQEASARKILQILLKIAIFAALILLLYFQLQNGLQRVGEGELYFWQKGFSFLQTVYLFFAIVLMPLNWGLELMKWQSLMHKAEQLDTKTAFKAMLAGITFALFTPNQKSECGATVYIHTGVGTKSYIRIRMELFLRTV